MAKFDLSCEFTGVHGKLNKKGGDYFRTNRQDGTVIRCHRSAEYVLNDKIKEFNEQFSSRSKAVSAWMKDPANAEALAEFKQRFKSQHKIGTFFPYLVKNLNLDGTTSGTSTSPIPSGGSSASVGGDL